jgi:hypothetical protein
VFCGTQNTGWTFDVIRSANSRASSKVFVDWHNFLLPYNKKSLSGYVMAFFVLF